MNTYIIRGLSMKIDLESPEELQVMEAVAKCNALLEFFGAEIRLPSSLAGPIEVEACDFGDKEIDQED